ncbi:Rieske (2Fe-2S) protein [Microbulbifer pacificus]|uniref:Rieske (2Fe-2S) protein n=1 Tax=Microbulbifer pacificus TaxID=407164 RepID=UPI000CF41C44|nr:Rieske 2Fe-2S domain-containing protein [Microbulbifer pacificus]
MSAVPVGLVAQFPPGSRWLLNVRGQDIALFNVDGQLYAIDDRCPHAGSSLVSGRLDGKVIQCLAHGLRFDLATGEFRPGSKLCVATYPVSVVQGQILVDVSASIHREAKE